MHEVKVVYTPHCPWNPGFLRAMRHWAEEAGASFRALDISQSPDEARELLRRAPELGRSRQAHIAAFVDGELVPGHPADPEYKDNFMALLEGRPVPERSREEPPRGGEAPAVRYVPINPRTLDLAIDFCLLYHPSGMWPEAKAANAGREAARRALAEVLEAVPVAGYLALRPSSGGPEPVALLKWMPRPLARAHGYVTGEGDGDGVLTLVCLEATGGVDREAVLEGLLRAALEEAAPPGYHTVEACARGETASLYRRAGFSAVEERGEALILSRPLGVRDRG